MPILDHFHPPLSEERHWEGFHSKWANVLVDELNQNLLPPGYFAEPHVRLGAQVEIDAATFGQGPNGESGSLPQTARGTPVPPTLVMPSAFTDTFEVQVVNTEAGPRLVAAIELVSPANKDRANHRRAFAVKCASYLCQPVSLMIVDIVTARHGNLHDEIAALLPEGTTFRFPGSPSLYASAYRPVRRGDSDEIDTWLVPLAVGESLPVLPLAIAEDVVLSVDLESTYLESCRRLRLPTPPLAGG